MISLRLAWRNLWRNGRRTAITAMAIGLSTAILVATFGLMRGMMVDMLNNVTELAVGDAQVHAPQYRADRSFYRAIPPETVAAMLQRAGEEGIRAAPRSYGFGLVSSGAKSSGALFWGVDPRAEVEAFKLAKRVARGAFLTLPPEATTAGAQSTYLGRPVREVVLGRRLAKSLAVEVGSEVVVVVQAADGSLGNELYTVTGVLGSASEDVDRSGALVHREDFDELFVADGRVHELAFNARGALTAEQVVERLQPVAGGQELVTWRTLVPAFSDMANMFDAAMWIFAAIFLLAAGLGVMNTMLMATYERIREFGVQKALGASPWRILRDVSSESLVMSLFASAIGVVVGLAGTWYLAVVGIDLSAAGGTMVVEGVVLDNLWRAELTPACVLQPTIAMWVACVLAALYPAAKAARIDPVKAMTHV